MKGELAVSVSIFWSSNQGRIREEGSYHSQCLLLPMKGVRRRRRTLRRRLPRRRQRGREREKEKELFP